MEYKIFKWVFLNKEINQQKIIMIERSALLAKINKTFFKWF